MMSREIAPTVSLYGERYTELIQAAPEYAGREVTRAWNSGIAYEGWTLCRANNETCTARRAKGTDFCIGHLNQMKKQEAAGESA